MVDKKVARKAGQMVDPWVANLVDKKAAKRAD